MRRSSPLQRLSAAASVCRRSLPPMSSKKRAAGAAAVEDAEINSGEKRQKTSGASATSPAKHASKNNNSSLSVSGSGSMASASAAIASAAAAAASTSSSSALTPVAYSAVAQAHAARFQVYTTETSERAHRILHVVLPRKVLELDAAIQLQPPFAHSIQPPFNEDGTFIAGKEKEIIGSNPTNAALITQVNAEVLELIENLGALKLMIQLRIPAVESESNFGVEVQEESINELAKAEDVAFGSLDKINNYYGNRTRVIAKISKYPAILDYWQGVKELDEVFYTDLRLFCVDMRNTYTTLHDLLLKNEERINNPNLEGESGRNRRHAFA